MKPFLKQVADLYYNTRNISGRYFIFPNRRSIAFFRKYLGEAVAADPDAMPLLSPPMLTINDFFNKVSGVEVADRVRLLLELYDCYKELNPKAESLDEFIFWGDVILGDFDDVDKYLVDPKQLFTNVADFKQLQDTFSYLSETQRKAIEGFVSHFNDRSGKLTVDIGSGNVKGRFLQIWNLLYPLYCSFHDSLLKKGMAYEGMVYRGLAERMDTEPAAEVLKGVSESSVKYVFVGLNALNECEKQLLRKLRDASMAEFCWDWAGDLIRDPQNRSSFFMKDNMKEFPQVDGWEESLTSVPEINVISVASSTGQAKRLPDILQRVADKRYGGDLSCVNSECAVILPDESLLSSVLNSISPQIADINVTMGLPMTGSLMYAMMSEVDSIQIHSVCKGGKLYFYHKPVWDLFSNAVFRKAADEQTMKILSQVKASAKYYIPQEDLCGTVFMDAIFRQAIDDPKASSSSQIQNFAEYQKTIVKTFASVLSDDVSLALELEYAKEYYRCVNILQEINLEVLPVTYIRLLGQLLSAVSVPFKGEPLKGLQIMGPLETRALDFKDMIIMSANEGIFPRRSVSSSFIPPELRKGFGMPTYEYQDAMWAYYFYRMISRAETVWMLVDTRTEGLKSGEESRFIKQLEYHFRLPLKRSVVKFTALGSGALPPISKTTEDVDTVRNTVLSATAVQSYLACPAKFYYGTIKGLELEEDVSESLDYGMFGNVYHDLMRSIYADEYAMSPDFFFEDYYHSSVLPFTPMGRISRSYIEAWLGREDDIRKKVKSLIIRQLNAIEVTGRNIVIADVIVKYVMKTLQRDLEQMKMAGVDSFDILGRELKVSGEFHGQKFKGFIDRLDSFSPDQARVVDYKTGRVLDDDEDIHDGNAVAIAEKIFAQDVKDRPKIAFQFFVYDMLLKSRQEVQGKKLYNCIYSTSNLFKEVPSTVPLNALFYAEVSSRLEAMLDEIYDLSVPFRRTEDQGVCAYCDFKNICGR